MTDTLFAPVRNGQALPLAAVPDLTLGEFRAAVIQGVRSGLRLACLCADAELNLYAVLAEDGVIAIIALERATTAAGLALIARRKIRIIS